MASVFDSFVLEDHLDEIKANMGVHPVAHGGYGDLYTSSVREFGKLAIKYMRNVPSEERSRKVRLSYFAATRWTALTSTYRDSSRQC